MNRQKKPGGISWCDYTSNPIGYRLKATGKRSHYCQKISPGCANCYAERLGVRFGGPKFTVPNLALVEPFLDEKELGRWRSPKLAGKRVFVGDMTDIFGEWTEGYELSAIAQAADDLGQTNWMFLTKRAEIMAAFFLAADPPAPNIWLGFSAENQETFDARWPHMAKLAAAGWLVFASLEPLLGPINIEHQKTPDLETPFLSWVIAGGESGTGARPMHPDWARSARDQCVAAGVPFHFKQLGRNPVGICVRDSHGGDPEEWPEDLRIRQFPQSRLADAHRLQECRE